MGPGDFYWPENCCASGPVEQFVSLCGDAVDVAWVDSVFEKIARCWTGVTRIHGVHPSCKNLHTVSDSMDDI